MNRDSKTNYHNSLKQFTNGIDPMMEKMRTSFKETQGSGFITRESNERIIIIRTQVMSSFHIEW